MNIEVNLKLTAGGKKVVEVINIFIKNFPGIPFLSITLYENLDIVT